MSHEELRNRIRDLANECDKSREQQAIKSVLLGVVAVMYSRRELALMDHAANFAESEIKRMTAVRN